VFRRDDPRDNQEERFGTSAESGWIIPRYPAHADQGDVDGVGRGSRREPFDMALKSLRRRGEGKELPAMRRQPEKEAPPG
jgi:hypothetical protein